MKITAEFNSTEELVSFIGAFGNKTAMAVKATPGIAPVVETKKTFKTEVVKKLDKPVETIKEEIKDVVPAKEAETPKEEYKKEEAKVTKEMIRERLGAIMKSGKQKEAKDLLAKHGASKLPELKEEEYAAVFEEAEALL